MKKIVLLAFVLVLYSLPPIARCARLFSTSIPVQAIDKSSQEINTVIHTIADTYVDANYHWENYGSSNLLAVWNGTIPPYNKYVSFLLFDLTGLGDSKIISVMLFLRVVVHSVDSNQTSIVGVHFYNESWNEHELTWDTVNWSSLNETATDTTEVYLDLLEYRVWFNWTVTHDVQKSKGSFLTEVVRAENDIESIFFSSRETSYVPYLNITYIELPVHNIDSGKNFSTIQEAINDNETLDGHIIRVDAGTYYEHVVVNKSISLIGENRETTIVDGDRTGNVIHVKADNVTITGFTIQNSGPSCGLYIFSSSSNNISHNFITNNDVGIHLGYSSDSILTGNIVSHNKEMGIYIERESDSNVVIHNNVSNSGEGIGVALSSNCIVVGNTVSSNNVYGIWVSFSDNNTVSGNIASNNGIGIWVRRSRNNTFAGNTISNNGYGIELVDYSDKNTFTNNTVSNNAVGMYIDNSIDNVIYHNNFIGNPTQVISSNSINTWDDGYPSGGNYWSDYEDRYPYAEEIDGSGMWDTTYVIDENNEDNYPIVSEFPTWTSMLLILIVLTVAIAIYKRRLLKTPIH